MRIDAISTGNLPSVNQVGSSAKPAEGGSFGGTIKQAISKVNDLQAEANQLANKLAAGDAVEIHQAIIAMQKAGAALQFTVQVRNKVIEAYQEIMRMQV